jgi:hypothetical protein
MEDFRADTTPESTSSRTLTPFPDQYEMER